MPASPLHLLLVDDNDLDALKIARAVEAMDVPHTLVRARDGLEALAHLKRGDAVTLILLDLKMPRMNGWTGGRTKSVNMTRAGIFRAETKPAKCPRICIGVKFLPSPSGTG